MVNKYTRAEAPHEDNLCENAHTEAQISEESVQYPESKTANPKIQFNFLKGNKENAHKGLQPKFQLAPKTQMAIKQTTKSYSILPEDINQENKSTRQEKKEGMIDLADRVVVLLHTRTRTRTTPNRCIRLESEISR